MSKQRPPLSAKKPNPDFIWPPTEEQLTERSPETVQPVNRYVDRPTDLEPPLTNIETRHSQALKPRLDFDWPPTEGQLAAAGLTRTDHGATREGSAGATAATPVASSAASLSSVSVSASQRPTPISPDVSRVPADGDQATPSDNAAVMDAVPTPAEAAEPEWIDDLISVISVAQEEPVFDGVGTGDWAADVTHLQALIERITERIDWRITSLTGH